MTQIIPKVYVTRFFQLVTSRQFAEAERVLDRVKQKIKMNERNRGYFQALYGMLLAQKSNDDRYAFLSNLSFQEKKELQSYRREFQRHSDNRLHADYDRGFFAAWADYMRILFKLELPSAPSPNKNKAQRDTEPKKTEPETKEEIKELADEKTAKAKKEIKVEEPEEVESIKRVEPRQSSLVDFSKLTK